MCLSQNPHFYFKIYYPAFIFLCLSLWENFLFAGQFYNSRIKHKKEMRDTL